MSHQLNPYSATFHRAKSLTLEIILATVCNQLGLNIEAIKGGSQKSELVTARKLYAKFARQFTPESQKKIGSLINRSHCNVIHYIKQAENHLINEIEFKFNHAYILLKLNKLKNDGQ